MNVRKFVVFVIALLVLITLTALAHSGRTDSNGGHWDIKTGTYHFHTGEYAGKSSSGSSSSSEYVPFTPPYEPPTENPYITDSNDITESKQYEDKSDWEILKNVFGKVLTWTITLWMLGLFVYVDFDKGNGYITFSIIIFAVSYFFWKLLTSYLLVIMPVTIGITMLCFGLYKLYRKTDYKGRIDKYEQSVNEYIFYKTKQEAKEAEYLAFERIPISDDCEIGFDGLPKEKKSNGWGKTFTVYQSRVGNKIHTIYGCCSAYNAKHIYKFYCYSNWYNLRCKKCALTYIPPDMSWYDNYVQYNKLLQEIFSLNDSKSTLKEDIINSHKECDTLLIKFILWYDKKNRKRLKKINDTVYSLKIITKQRR